MGTLLVAKWYRTLHPKHLLVSLDSAETRRWMNLEDDARRADLLGLSMEGNTAFIDILESKSGEDATHVYTIDGNGKITGKPVEQLVNTGRSVEAIFGLNEWKDHILTPPRREILRNHLYRQGFAGHRTPEEKQTWGRILNSLFSQETKPVIRLNLIVVNLGLNQQPLDQMVDAGRIKIHLVHLNEQSINVHLGDSSLSSSDEPPVVEPETEPEPLEEEQPEPAAAESFASRP